MNTALAELCALKRPNGIFFSRGKSNTNLLPFEDATSLEFWSHKNDASIVLVGSHSKKRPHALTWTRMFDHLLLDMLELGIERITSMKEFKVRCFRDAPADPQTPKAAVGAKPLFHFAGELFDSHPVFIQLKSLLLDTFHGEVVPSINLAGLGHVISISHGPIPSTSAAPVTSVIEDTGVAALSTEALPLVHFRVYGIQLLKSGRREPRVNLIEHGPSIDFRIRRTKPADDDVWKRAIRHKPSGPQTAEAAAKKRKRDKNVDISEMGDKIGRIHVGRQDLDKLQSRKMKGLKVPKGDAAAAAATPAAETTVEGLADADDGAGIAEVDTAIARAAKRQRAA